MSRRVRREKGVTATVNQPATRRSGEPGPGGNGYVRGSFDRERQGRSAYLVGVLARALATQVDEIARACPPAPDGWWFTEPARPTDRKDGAR